MGTAYRQLMGVISVLGIILVGSVMWSYEAKAEVALWEDQGNWVIYGDTDHQICSANAIYDTGRGIHLVFNKENMSIVLTGLDLEEGAYYDAIMQASTGDRGTMQAYATSRSTAIFYEVNDATVKAFAEAKAIFIQGLGIFELTGSKRAMAAAWECYKTLSSY